jgi:hypothetical protein
MIYLTKHKDGNFTLGNLTREELDEIRRGLAVAWGEGQTNNRKLNQELLSRLEGLFDNKEMEVFYKTYEESISRMNSYSNDDE